MHSFHIDRKWPQLRTPAKWLMRLNFQINSLPKIISSIWRQSLIVCSIPTKYEIVMKASIPSTSTEIDLNYGHLQKWLMRLDFQINSSEKNYFFNMAAIAHACSIPTKYEPVLKGTSSKRLTRLNFQFKSTWKYISSKRRHSLISCSIPTKYGHVLKGWIFSTST